MMRTTGESMRKLAVYCVNFPNATIFTNIFPVIIQREKNIIEENHEWNGDYYDIIP